MPLRAVIFDYGMVLTGPANPQAHQRMIELSQLPKSIYEENYWRHRLDYDRGTLNGQTYWQAVARTASTTLDQTTIECLIEQDILLWTDLNPIMLRWVTQVQASGLRTAILSNMGEELLGHMRQNFAWLETFEHCTWSCELDIVKPEAAIYLHTLEKLGLRAEEALFLDDRLENVEGARHVGMHAMQFQDAATLQVDLVSHGWLTQLPPVTG